MKVRGPVRSIIDQGCWGLVNVSVVVLVALRAGVEDFGLFGIAYSAAMVVSGMCIAASGEALAVARGRLLREGDGSQSNAPEVKRAAERALGVVAVLAGSTPVISGSVVLPFAFHDADPMLAILFLAFSPVTVLADGLRSIFYAMRRLDEVVWLSRIWIAVQVGLSVGFHVVSDLTASLAIIAWGLAGISTVATGLYLGFDGVTFRGATRDERTRRVRFALEQLATAAPPNATVPLAAAFIGLPAAAVMRALQTIYGPLNVALAGLRLFLVPVVSEEVSERRVMRAGGGLALVAVIVTGGLTVLLAGVPQLGRLLFGESWTDDALLLVGFGIGRCAIGVVLGALIVLRARDAVRSSSRLRFASAVSFVLCFTVFASIDLRSAVWASTLASLVMAVFWCVSAYRRTSSSPRRSGRSGPVDDRIEGV